MADEIVISFPRGDLYAYPFSVILDNQKVTEMFDEIWFTVKKKYNETEYLLQKRMRDGGIIGDGSGNYVVMIMPEDTDGLGFGEYVCDIQVQKLPSIKKTIIGTFELTYEVTHRGNEGESFTPGAETADTTETDAIIDAYGTEVEITNKDNLWLRTQADVAGEADALLIIYAPTEITQASGESEFDVATAAEVNEIIIQYQAA